MAQYGISAALMLASAAFLAVGAGWNYDRLTPWPVALGAILYVAGAVWWLALVVRAKRRLWLHFALAWAPAIGPLWPFAIAMARDDTGFATMAHMGSAGVAVLASLTVALIVLLRMAGVGAPEEV
jgi:hypothetical protein